MNVKHNILHVVYLHHREIKEKPVCVTDFTCILLKNQVHSVCGFRCLQKVSSKINFLQSIFAAFLVVLGSFRLYKEFDDYKFQSIITAYDSMIYGTGFGCKNSLKIATFRPNSMTQRIFAGTIKP